MQSVDKADTWIGRNGVPPIHLHDRVYFHRRNIVAKHANPVALSYNQMQLQQL